MKIAFLSHLDLNLYLFRLPVMRELVSRGYEVYAICPKGDYFKKFNKFGINAVSYKIKRGSINPLYIIKTIKEIEQILKDIRPDILHTFTHQPNIYGTIAATNVKIKHIYNLVEGLGSVYISSKLYYKVIQKVINIFYKYIFANSELVFFVNSDDPKYFLDRGILKKEKVVVIKSVGVDTSYFKSSDKIKNKRPIILMVARVLRDKGVQEYIDAAEILKEKADFWYAGDIDDGNKNAFLPDWKNVKFLGFRDDMIELIQKCDIFVLPSYREGVPRTLLEAASMSRPIVTTNAVGCREVVDDGYNGFLVPVKDHGELTNKIKKLIDNENLREIMGQNGRKKVLREFSIGAVVKQYMEFYDKKII